MAQYVYEYLMADVEGFSELDVVATAFKLDFCYYNNLTSRDIQISAQGKYLGNRPTLLKRVGDTLEIRMFEKYGEGCIGNYSLATFETDQKLNISEPLITADGIEMYSKLVFESQSFSYQENNNYVEFAYNFKNYSTCSDTVQKGYIRTDVCVNNYFAYGDDKSVDDVIFVHCDTGILGSTYLTFHSDLDCTEELFSIRFRTGLQEIIGDICTELDMIRRNVVVKCKKEEELDKKFLRKEFGGTVENFKSTNFAQLEIYHRPYDEDTTESVLKSNGWKCNGDKMLSLPISLGECSGNQIAFANENWYVIHTHEVDDENCEEKPLTIHIANLEELVNLNPKNKINNDTCIDAWLGREQSYYRNFIFFDTYDLEDWKNNLAILPGIDCSNEEEMIKNVVEYKKRPVRNFMISHQDFCISKNSLVSFSGEDFKKYIGYTGYCSNGKPIIREYNKEAIYSENVCTGFPNTIKEEELTANGFCVDNNFLTCLNYVCNDLEAIDPNVCNRKGICTKNGCECFVGYAGSNCDVDLNLATGITVSISISVLVSIIVVSLILTVLTIVIVLFIKSQKRLKQFKEVEDFDIILEEHRVSRKRTSIKIDKSLFEIQRKDIKLVSKLGEGGSGNKVYLAEWKGHKVAYKSFKNVGIEDGFFVEFEKEVKLFASLHHPSILLFFGACINLPDLGILLEYCPQGDLTAFLSANRAKNTPVSKKEKIRLLKEIASGMFYLHSINILHRDLKPENVLVDDINSVKIMDFGLAKFENANSEKTLTKRVGTSYYMSPEVFAGKQYSEKCDVFSFAILMYVLITERFSPYGKELNEWTILNKVASSPDFRPKIQKEDFEEIEFLIPIIEKNWGQIPEERNSFKDIEMKLKEQQEIMNKISEKVTE